MRALIWSICLYHVAFSLYRTGMSSAWSVITMVFFIILLILEFKCVGQKEFIMKIEKNTVVLACIADSMCDDTIVSYCICML